MSDAEPELSAKLIADTVFKDGLGELLKDKEVRQACCGALAAVGVKPPLNQVVVFALGGALGFVGGLAGDRAVNSLANLMESTPGLRTVLASFVRVCAACQDKAELRANLLAVLRGETAPTQMKVNSSTPVEVLAVLRNDQQATELKAELTRQMTAVSCAFDTWFAEFYEPRLQDPSAAGSPDSVAGSLKYTAERDAFVGRKDDLNFLHRLIGDETMTMLRRPVLWQLMIGPGGLGKSRLALQFMHQARALSWNAGFLRDTELQRLDPSRWRPRRPTVMIIDYPARAAELISGKLADLAAFGDEYLFPLRIILLERRTEGDWYRQLVPPTSSGDAIHSIRFAEPRELSRLSSDEVLALMRGRLPEDTDWTDDEVLQSLRQVDNRTVETDAGPRWAPRPLFAVATAEVLASSADRAPLTRIEVLNHILNREEHLWSIDAEEGSLAAHRLLLALACMTLGLKLEALTSADRIFDDLPSTRLNDGRSSLDRNLYQRMTGTPGLQFFNGLEPDLLGEWFVVRLLTLFPEGRSRLVDTAFDIGGQDAAVFTIRAVADFPESEAIELLCVTTAATTRAQRAFVWACVDLTGRNFDLVSPDKIYALWERVKSLAAANSDPEFLRQVGRVAYNVALVQRLYHNHSLQEETFSWMKELADRFPAKEFEELVAEVAYNVATGHARKGDVQAQRDVSAWLDRFAERQGSAHVRETAESARASLLITLMRHGIEAEAHELSDQLFGATSDGRDEEERPAPPDESSHVSTNARSSTKSPGAASEPST